MAFCNKPKKLSNHNCLIQKLGPAKMHKKSPRNESAISAPISSPFPLLSSLMAADTVPIFTNKLDDSLALQGEENEDDARRPYRRQSGALLAKLQRPISKDERSNRKWWKRAFGLFTKKSASGLCIRSRVSWGALLYETESSGPLRGLEFLQEGAPYINLSDLNLVEDRGFSSQKTMTRPPIYLVT